MDVDLRGPGAGRPEQFLYVADVRAVLKEMGGEAMAQAMQGK